MHQPPSDMRNAPSSMETIMRNFIRNAVVASLTFWAAGAGAQPNETGWYLGIGAGVANYSENIPQQIATAYRGNDTYELLGARTLDSADAATQIFVGYRFLPWLAAELGYQDLGSARTLYSLHATQPVFITIPPTIMGEYRTSDVNAALVASWPVGERFELLARGGVADTRLTYDEHGIDVNGDPFAFHAPKRTHVSAQAGVGALWKFAPSFGLRLDLDRNFDVGKKFALNVNENGRFDYVDAYTVNLIWMP